jgi:hypothetical protein
MRRTPASWSFAAAAPLLPGSADLRINRLADNAQKTPLHRWRAGSNGNDAVTSGPAIEHQDVLQALNGISVAVELADQRPSGARNAGRPSSMKHRVLAVRLQVDPSLREHHCQGRARCRRCPHAYSPPVWLSGDRAHHAR